MLVSRANAKTSLHRQPHRVNIQQQQQQQQQQLSKVVVAVLPSVQQKVTTIIIIITIAQQGGQALPHCRRDVSPVRTPLNKARSLFVECAEVGAHSAIPRVPERLLRFDFRELEKAVFGERAESETAAVAGAGAGRAWTGGLVVMEERVEPVPSVASGAQMKEARLLVRMREAHSKALQMAAATLRPEAFERYVRPIKAQVGDDVDTAMLAANVVSRVVEQSEEGFRQLCERMSVNEKLLALERREKERGSAAADGFLAQGEQQQQGEPLPGGRQPSELVREGRMRLKLLERDRLKGLAEEAERSAEGEAARVAGIEAALEKRLGEVTAIEQALTEVVVELMVVCRGGARESPGGRDADTAGAHRGLAVESCLLVVFGG
eukprot:jgi/Undpi1/1884/HiC_scaffold_12.g05271.m1